MAGFSSAVNGHSESQIFFYKMQNRCDPFCLIAFYFTFMLSELKSIDL